MASKSVFQASKGSKAGVSSSPASIPATDTVNLAGGKAYSLEARAALAQLAVTGCFEHTFYASGGSQLDKVKELIPQVEPDFVGRLAVYSREKGFMKDMPAFLVAYLMGLVGQKAKTLEGKKGAEGIEKKAEFDFLAAVTRQSATRVIDNGKMVRNVVQIIRSGQTGRKNLGTSPKKMLQSFFEKTPEQIFFSSVGGTPSLADVIRLVRPKPATKEHAALFAYLLGKEKGSFKGEAFVTKETVPTIVKVYEAFKTNPNGELPAAPYEMLEGLPLSAAQWKALALRSSWQQTRQHLNTFLKKGVFGKEGAWDTATVEAVAKKLADPDAIGKAKAMPYQLMIAYAMMGSEMPMAIKLALQQAMEIACKNVPVIEGTIAVFPDVSGSMHSAITGTRTNPVTGKVESHTSKVRCIDVAGLISAAFLRKNPKTTIIPFDTSVHRTNDINPMDSIMTNAAKLAAFGGGGTSCELALAEINRQKLMVDLCIYVSDNESWIGGGYHRGTGVMNQWEALKKRCPGAKLVCLDLTPNTSTQAQSRDDILNIGGFSDAVFPVIEAFYKGNAQSWVDEINRGDF